MINKKLYGPINGDGGNGGFSESSEESEGKKGISYMGAFFTIGVPLAMAFTGINYFMNKGVKKDVGTLLHQDSLQNVKIDDSRNLVVNFGKELYAFKNAEDEISVPFARLSDLEYLTAQVDSNSEKIQDNRKLVEGVKTSYENHKNFSEGVLENHEVRLNSFGVSLRDHEGLIKKLDRDVSNLRFYVDERTGVLAELENKVYETIALQIDEKVRSHNKKYVQKSLGFLGSVGKGWNLPSFTDDGKLKGKNSERFYYLTDSLGASVYVSKIVNELYDGKSAFELAESLSDVSEMIFEVHLSTSYAEKPGSGRVPSNVGVTHKELRDKNKK